MPSFGALPHLRIVSALLTLAIVTSWVAVSFAHTGRLVLVIHNQTLVRYGGATAATLAAGEWWRLVTSQFVHVYLPHALLNAAAVLVVGSQLERAVGVARVVVLYVCAGTAGQLAAVALAPTIVATGASQAATGICAASLVICLASPDIRRLASIAPAAYLTIQGALDLLYAGQIKPPHVVSFGVGVVVGTYWLWRRAQ